MKLNSGEGNFTHTLVQAEKPFDMRKKKKTPSIIKTQNHINKMPLLPSSVSSHLSCFLQLRTNGPLISCNHFY